MGEKFDIIVAGGGHNGLTTGAYLAKAGMKVCVVERQDKVGGGVVTRELTEPGFKHDHCGTWHGFVQANPLIQNDELELLSKFGLEYLYPEIHTSVIFPDDRVMMFYRDVDKTCESIAQFSEKDAEAYRRFYDWSIGILDMFTAGMYAPPPPFGSFAAMLDQNEIGQELLRAMLVSGLDICNDWFENDHVKIAMTRFVSEGMMAPQTRGTGIVLFVFVPLSHKYGGGTPVGGSGALSEALERCIEHNGGTIRVSSPVKEFKIAGGEVTGVVLESGEEILAAKAVVTSLNMKQIFPGMVEGADLPEGYIEKVKRIIPSDFSCLNQAYALHESPKYKAGGDVDKSLWVEFSAGTLEEYLRSFGDFRYGIPATKFPLAICSTLFDKTRAPEGKHTLYLYHYEPYDLKGGGARKWDEIGDEIADGILETVRGQATNMGDDNIIGKRWIMTPLDLERYNPAMVGGDNAHAASMLANQSGANRPLPGSSLRLPIKNFYICGASTHPGGGVSGGGRATAMVVMEDLGIDFEKIVG